MQVPSGHADGTRPQMGVHGYPGKPTGFHRELSNSPPLHCIGFGHLKSGHCSFASLVQKAVTVRSKL
eukprot:3590221-Amphidinium_carterae.1